MTNFSEWWEAEEVFMRAEGADDEIILGAMRNIAATAWDAALDAVAIRAGASWDADQTKWKPIETAPIGIWCLFLDGRGTMDAARYGHAVHVDKVLQKADNDPIHETFYNYYHNYTHWMPLPEAPQEDEK